MPATPFQSLSSIPRWKSLRNSLRFAHNPITVLNENTQHYGHTYRFHLGGFLPGILTTDPGLIQHILQRQHRSWRKSPVQTELLGEFLGNGLLTSDGEYWLRQRRLIQPGFHRARLEALSGIMLKEVDDFLDNRFEPAIRKSTLVDLAPLMMELAFRVVAKSLFTTDLREEDVQLLSRNVTAIQAYIMRTLRQPYLMPWFRLSGQAHRHKELSRQSDLTIMRYIQARRQSGVRNDDLLQMLLDARYEDTGQGMTDQQLMEEAAILFVAGHETTANALSWTWYLLSQHPSVVSRLREEFDSVLGGRPPVFADLPRLQYSMQVIEESMRLYPPAWITDRLAVEDNEYEGLFLPKGSRVVAYIYGVHHRPDLWPDPEAFRPERFAREEKGAYHSFAYMPFGGGPRQCIGNNFALMEIQLILLRMLSRYDMELDPGHEIGLEPLVTLRPRFGMRMIVKNRKK